MKKFISLFFIIVCLLSFACCGGKQEETTAAFTEPTMPLTVTVTFPEGYTVKQVAELLEKNSVCSAADFISASNDIAYLRTLDYAFLKGISQAKNRPFVLEGYIFPDTYEFYTGESAKDALSRFLDNTESKLTAAYAAQATAKGYTMDEILTIASIIQEEASEHQHMPGVSSVLHNRLESYDFGRLQCDVTINYINDNIKDSPYFSASLTQVHENYDTYECYGLPLGPICNPGIHAIEAALYPPETNYFFFVTDDEWNYYYAETYEEHQENCESVGLYGR